MTGVESRGGTSRVVLTLAIIPWTLTWCLQKSSVTMETVRCTAVSWLYHIDHTPLSRSGDCRITTTCARFVSGSVPALTIPLVSSSASADLRWTPWIDNL